MISSFGLSILFLILKKMGAAPGTYQAMLITIGCTTVLWIATAYFGPRTDEAALLNFYRKVRPPGPGWKHIQAIAGISPAQAETDREDFNFPMSLLGWFTGCITIWSGPVSYTHLDVYKRQASGENNWSRGVPALPGSQSTWFAAGCGSTGSQRSQVVS